MNLLDPRLAEILVCPADHGDLTEHVERLELECQVCGRIYPVQDGIPIMLIKDDNQV